MDAAKPKTNGGDGKAAAEAHPRESTDAARPGVGQDSVEVSERVIAAIVRRQALAVDGVVRLGSGSLMGGLKEMLGRKSPDSSIVLDIRGDDVSVAISLVMRFGVRLPDVAAQVQEAVRRQVAELTGKRVTAVKVAVQGIEDAPAPQG
ncbi:MAG: hypothetical protein BWZ02_01214 [Lentisphaerae bacterium ADurb.BinA184]|nr:MAG: hypothetical protein BWZ02_01214 [Lentisphaerae bacterium ADurb.BinA184]